ncbi:hypothetical protein ACSBR2_012683 [Camellia fascicularis]
MAPLLQYLRKEVLDLERNKINDAFPYLLETRLELQVLVLKFNRFHGHIDTFKTKSKLHFPKLRIINISYNEFTGLLPTNYISRFEAMMNVDEHELKLKYMGDMKFSENIFLLPNLRELNVGRNSELTGKLPYFNVTSSLQFLDLSGTSFSSQLPESISNLKALNILSLLNCDFSGSIPTSFGNLTQITQLDLLYNNFSSQIPSSISNLAKLTYLYLFGYNLNGQIPDSLGNMSQLTNLDLSLNILNGQILDSLGNMNQLTNLDLSGNNLDGQIPDSLGNMSQLTSLHLSYDSLNGTIPSSLFALPSLVVIGLSNNKLQGPIPGSVYELQNLTDLLLSSNNLSGVVDLDKLLKLKNLIYVDLSYNGINSFRGTFTATFTKGNVLRNLNLNGNQVEGQVPRSLLNCRHLEVLDLGKNKINDTVPHWLGTLRNLQVLVLRSNRFHDHIGTFKIKSKHPFPKLRIIDIACTEFPGLLPTNYIKQFGAMMNVDEHVKLKYMGQTYYQDSVVVMIKGYEIELLRILTVFSIIDFSRNKFQGEILKSIGRLNSLRGLNLSHNNLEGHIPTSLGNLKNLESLDLSSNKFVGKIPQQLKMGTWPDVDSLYQRNVRNYSHCHCHQHSNKKRIQTSQADLTDPLGNISQLAFLTLFENQQTGPIPSYAVGISKLTYIGLQNNSLNGTIPSWLFAQPSLISIDLSNNMLQGPIPGSIYELQNLTYLRLSSNNFSGVIELDKFLKLKYMYYLDLSYNGLSLNINNSANSTLHYFETIGLASCNLSEFPNFLRVLHDLIALDLSNNKIHGEAPKWILDVGKNTLDVLDLSQNFLTSLECLPWKNLEHINLHSNLFRGPLPVPPITTIVFSISNNKLIGEIPTLICSLMSLEVLDLSNNSLSGVKFSKNIFHFPNLRELHVWGNLELTVSNLKALNILYLFNCNLSGSIAASLWNLTQITKLGFLSNSFSGQIPSSISNLAKINHLYHSQNNLNGQISDSLGNMSQLTSLSLSYNSLNGTIPSSLFALPSLVDIELSNNKLLGSIPGLVYELHNLTYLLLGVVELDKLLKLKNLIYLDLSYNGHIPTSLGNLTNLESLDLSSNELVGDIPSQLASLMFLEVLNLSDNQLVGQIPQGSQFNTFGNDSYNGNLALCGLPLSKKCEEQQLLPPPPTLQHDENSNWEGGFNWKVVLMGYGCGFVFGMVMGYLMFITRSLEWLMKIIEGKQCKKVKRSKKSTNGVI